MPLKQRVLFIVGSVVVVALFITYGVFLATRDKNDTETQPTTSAQVEIPDYSANPNGEASEAEPTESAPTESATATQTTSQGGSIADVESVIPGGESAFPANWQNAYQAVVRYVTTIGDTDYSLAYPGFDYSVLPSLVADNSILLNDLNSQISSWQNPRQADLDAYSQMNAQYNPYKTTMSITQALIRNADTPGSMIVTVTKRALSSAGNRIDSAEQFEVAACSKNDLGWCLLTASSDFQSP